VAKNFVVDVKLLPDFAHQKLSKLIDCSQSYSKNKSDTVFLRHGVVSCSFRGFSDWLQFFKVNRSIQVIFWRL